MSNMPPKPVLKGVGIWRGRFIVPGRRWLELRERRETPVLGGRGPL